MVAMAGKSLLTRRSQKWRKTGFPMHSSLSTMEVIRYPEMTKNTSTPAYPPVKPNTMP